MNLVAPKGKTQLQFSESMAGQMVNVKGLSEADILGDMKTKEMDFSQNGWSDVTKPTAFTRSILFQALKYNEHCGS